MLTKNKDFNFNELYGKFIANSKNGKRLQPNGKKLSDLILQIIPTPISL